MAERLSNIRLSTVTSSKITAENTVHRLTNTDLAMKLHYVKGVYLFKKEAAEGLTISEFKSAMFPLLDLYYPVAGRIRRAGEGGRPFIKCNDSGVRIVEAEANDSTLDEWLEMNKDFDDQLAYHDHVLGPDLGFSPLVFVQFTWFKCGGLSIGLSWAHIIGDIITASSFINLWAQVVAGKLPPQTPIPLNKGNQKSQFPLSTHKKPSSLQSVEPVGDYWLMNTPQNNKLTTISLHVSPKQLNQITSKTNNAKPFQALTAIIWKSLGKIRGESEPRIVTICKSEFQGLGIVGNSLAISTVEVDFEVSNADVLDLAEVLTKKAVDESRLIEESLEGENENSDFIVYGANLTFVDLEGVDMYGLELKGNKPILANYTLRGVGDEGVIMVLPSIESSRGGQRVTMILPHDQVDELKYELKREWGVY